MANYSQAEVSKLFADELAKAQGNPQAAETLRQQALSMGIPLSQVDTAMAAVPSQAAAQSANQNGSQFGGQGGNTQSGGAYGVGSGTAGAGPSNEQRMGGSGNQPYTGSMSFQGTPRDQLTSSQQADLQAYAASQGFSPDGTALQGGNLNGSGMAQQGTGQAGGSFGVGSGSGGSGSVNEQRMGQQKSDGGAGMPSMRPASANLGLGFGSGSSYVETSGDAIKQAFTDLSASGMSEGQIMQKVAGMAADNGWTQEQLTAGAQAVNPNITGEQVGGWLKTNAPSLAVNGNGVIGKASQTAAQAQTTTAGPAAQTQTLTAGPAQNATAQGYEAKNTDIASQYRNMGLSDPSGANARLLSGEVNNPYLDAQADNITKRLTKNLQENVLPGIGQGAMMAGGYGGSRQGIAQGKAIGETNDNLANALTNMYSSANEAAQGRMAGAAGNLSGIGAQVGIANTSGQNQAAQFGAAAQNQASQFNAGQGNQMSQFNAGQTNQGNQFNTGQANSMSQFNTGQANQGSQFNAGQANSFNLGLMNNATQNKGLDNSYELGKGGLANQQTATSNAFTLGQGNLGLGNRAQDNSYELGKGNLALGNKQADNSYSVGMANVGVAGQNAANNAASNQNSYNLGLSQLDSTNQRFGQQYALDVMNSQYNWANGGVNAMNGMQQQPVSYFNNFAGNTNTMGGMGGTGTNNQTLQGNPYLGAAGGYTMANKYLSGGW